MRKPSACAACRSRRRKCQTKDGRRACVHCEERGIPCVQGPPEGGYYDQRAQQRSQVASQALTPEGGSTSASSHHHGDGFSPEVVEPEPQATLPGLAMRLDLVRLYFDYIHDQFHSLFHRPSFIEDALQDRVPHSILFGMFALSARYVGEATCCP
ncbi:hypothetical protein EV126DRAFT_85681 [Verticillium dahliae]|nr:hypothetical protein EV126DRAFT_85681 [Verticillium dahliae]